MAANIITKKFLTRFFDGEIWNKNMAANIALKCWCKRNAGNQWTYLNKTFELLYLLWNIKILKFVIVCAETWKKHDCQYNIEVWV